MCEELGITVIKENSHTIYDLDEQGVIKMFDIYMQTVIVNNCFGFLLGKKGRIST
jgi:hypothetical protein